MIYEDRFGNILMQDEVEELSAWEIEERGIRNFREAELDI